MSAGVSTIRAPGYRADAAACRPASDVEIAAIVKSGLAASSGAWKTLPERPNPATAVRMGPVESVVIGPRYPRVLPGFEPNGEGRHPRQCGDAGLECSESLAGSYFFSQPRVVQSGTCDKLLNRDGP
ncbi:hypothetical protein RCH17_001601 [Arthrobacter sp. MP_M7]|nr:hypothetical protein [Arthrobacter sp. MP_M4]MEC5202795.1 hypothetical protein [Arthrobacter sp. MP_M7]